MSEYEFPSFPLPNEDARALLARLTREIGLSAVAAALDLDRPEAPRAADLCDALSALTTQVRAA